MNSKILITLNATPNTRHTTTAQTGAYLFLNVTDVADVRWEGIRFEVKNVEDERFSLYCADFEVMPG